MKEIYCDGSCHGNPGPGGWGVYIQEDDKTYELFGHNPQTTNIQMEMKAAIEAVRTISSQENATIYTDSEFVINGITKWMDGWKAKGWKGTKGPVKNVELWKQLDVLVQGKKITWQWVRGHMGNIGNEYADKLANLGTKGENSLSYEIQVKGNIQPLAESNINKPIAKVENESLKQISFEMADIVIHNKGNKYVVLSDSAYIESTGKSAYTYTSIENKDGKEWQREKSEMEDGRFKLYAPKPNENAVVIEILKQYKNKFEKAYRLLKDQCPHSIESDDKNEGSASCKYCDKYFGWYCPDSPDHACHYSSSEGKIELIDGELIPVPPNHDEKDESDDWCIFCGHPDERK